MRFIITLSLICLSLCSYGQKGKPVYLDIDTIKGADTIYVTLPELTGYYSLSLELYFDEVGGTSDGTGVLQVANDTNWVNATTAVGSLMSTSSDTIDIEDGLTSIYWLYGTPSNKYRVELIGTTGDTTRVISNYIRK